MTQENELAVGQTWLDSNGSTRTILEIDGEDLSYKFQPQDNLVPYIAACSIDNFLRYDYKLAPKIEEKQI